MRKTIAVLATLALAACAGANDSKSVTVPDTPLDTAAIAKGTRAAIDAWYAGMYAKDSAAIAAPLTSSFLLLEDTIPMTAVQLIEELKGDTSGTVWKADFSNFRSQYTRDVAWTTLDNHETSTAKDGTTCSADFLETVVFVREGGTWRIDRYHAAARNRWTCPKK